MAVTNAEILGWLKANPTASDADVATAMQVSGVSPSQLAQVIGSSEGVVAARVAATLPPNQAVLLGDTYVQAVNQTIGSGEDQQVGGLENVITYKASDNKVGGGYNQYNADGTLARTGTQQEVNATKDFMDFALTAGSLFGLPVGIGEALGLSGAAGQAVGQGLLTTGTRLGGGESLADSLTAGLLGGGLVYGGAQLGDYIRANTPIDASNMTSAQFNDALEGQLVADMQAAGLSKDQISAFLDDMGIGQGVVTSVDTPATDVSAIDTVNVTGTSTPSSLLDSSSIVPTVNITSTKPEQISQDVLDAVTSQLTLNQTSVPTVNITADKPTTVNDVIAALTTNGFITDVPTVNITGDAPITTQKELESLISSLITTGATAIPEVVTPEVVTPEVVIEAEKDPTKPELPPAKTIVDVFPKIVTPEVVIEDKKDKPLKPTLPPPKKIIDVFPTRPTPPTPPTETSISDIVKIISVVPIIDAIVNPPTPPTPPSFPIVDIPPTWTNPPPTTVAPFTPLPAIDFGNRNLLRGTQWEKFLSPTYGQVPAPVQYSQPSNLSYNDLMGILGSRQGMPSRSNLSINDVISGIQNQYGQTPTRTMG
jgi:DNA-binding transcriptional regulator YhcF (GntR family)